MAKVTHPKYKPSTATTLASHGGAITGQQQSGPGGRNP